MGSDETIGNITPRSRNQSACRQRSVSDQNELDDDSPHDASTGDKKPDYTVHNLLASRGHGNDVGSFGSVYQRQHDDDSIVTMKTTTEEMDINTTPGVIVQMDHNLEIQQNNNTDDDKSYGASSAGFTTGTTRRELQEERRINKNLLLEMKQLTGQDSASDNQSTKTTQSTRVKLVEALAMIERM
jgi:hypothetical protein